jgi:hypothetical protein
MERELDEIEKMLADFGEILETDPHARDTVQFARELVRLAGSRVGHQVPLLEFSIQNAENAVISAQDIIHLRVTHAQKQRKAEAARAGKGRAIQSAESPKMAASPISSSRFASGNKSSKLKGLRNAISKNDEINLKLATVGGGNDREVTFDVPPGAVTQQEIDPAEEITTDTATTVLEESVDPAAGVVVPKKIGADPAKLQKLLRIEV